MMVKYKDHIYVLLTFDENAPNCHLHRIGWKVLKFSSRFSFHSCLLLQLFNIIDRTRFFSIQTSTSPSLLQSNAYTHKHFSISCKCGQCIYCLFFSKIRMCVHQFLEKHFRYIFMYSKGVLPFILRA